MLQDILTRIHAELVKARCEILLGNLWDWSKEEDLANSVKLAILFISILTYFTRRDDDTLDVNTNNKFLLALFSLSIVFLDRDCVLKM